MPSSIVLGPIVLIDPGATTQVMDATAMEYEDDTFDVIIDKSTLDALVRVGVHTHTRRHIARRWSSRAHYYPHSMLRVVAPVAHLQACTSGGANNAMNGMVKEVRDGHAARVSAVQAS